MNGTAGTANPYAAPFIGAITPVGDIDCVSVVATAGDIGDFFLVQTFGSDGVPCASSDVPGTDTQVDLIDIDGITVLDNNDDGPGNFCSLAAAAIDAAGTYFVCTRASSFPGATDSFPYKLTIDIVGECGNSILTAPEECDDANNIAQDGCSAMCTNEVCLSPTVAALGANAGDTAGAADASDSLCSTGPENVWQFAPAMTGTLTITVNSATDQGVSVRTACSDRGTEILCADDEVGGVDEILAVPVTAAVDVTIIVEAFNVGGVGPYTMTLALP
jgi:cysteine-rich repeat protein